MNYLRHLAAVLIFGFDLLLAVSGTDPNNELKREYDVCNPKTVVDNPNSVYLPNPENSTEVYILWQPTGNELSYINCLLYITTCDNCRIAVSGVGSWSYPTCINNIPPDGDTGQECIPNCVYFYLFDADYRSQTTKVFFSSPFSYTSSESRQLHIVACGVNYNRTIEMRLRLTAKEKLKVITYSRPSVIQPQLSLFTLTSPFFPSPYAKNREMYTYKLQSEDPYKIVVVTFDDWMLTTNSFFEFLGSKDVTRVTGSDNRPLVQSAGPNLTVNFYTGEPVSGQTSCLGFKATVGFTNSNDRVIKASTACDQDISSEGGIVRLTIPDGQMKDCIFVIRKMSRFDGVYLRILKVQSDGQQSTLGYHFDIYNGVTSMGELKAHIERFKESLSDSVFLSSDGFYIRYVGQYYDGSFHMLAYSMYLNDCDVVGGYFKCKNDRCISMALKCDGFDHCGDGSDEYTSLCTYETTHSSSSYPVSIGIIIPLVVSIFLIIVVCVLIIFIRRCRRLNNSARARRPPGLRPNRQRMRHNRDVQMSVTVRSGEHPPSYDEVLQNTPIGYLNMAFTWSQHGNGLAQPPTYEEAISPASQPNGGIIITTTANSGISHEEASRTSRQNSTVLTTTISASLDPRAEVSSSSSSEDAPDQLQQYDFSSSSDSSVENENNLNSNGRCLEMSRSNMNLNKANKDLNLDFGSQRSSPKSGSNEDGAKVILGSSGSAKVSYVGQEKVTPVLSQKLEESDGSRRENNAGREQLNVKEIRDSLGDPRNVSDGRVGQGILPSEQFDGKSVGIPNQSLGGRQDFKNAERELKQGRDRVDMYQKNKGKHSHHNIDREKEAGHRQGLHNDGLKIHLPKVTDSSRSQSCFDLSLGAGAVSSLDGRSAKVRDEDKRFSYAGAGDRSLARDGLDHFYGGRGLIRERPREHLDQYATQSYENIRDRSTIGNYDKVGSGVVNEQDELRQHRHNQSSNSAGYLPKSAKDKIDSQRAKGQYSNLAPVKENLFDETPVHGSLPGARGRHMYSEHTDDQLNNSSSDSWSQHRRNPLGTGRKFSQAMVLSSQETSPEARGPSHFLPGSTRSWPKDRMAVVPGHNDVDRHDYQKPSSDENRRAELSSRSHVDFNSQNADNSKNNIAYSGVQNYRGSGSPDQNKVPQSNKDASTDTFRPKPSLRKSRMKAAQRPGGHATGSVPNSTSQGHVQASHRPVPVPRQGVRKQVLADGRGPLPDAHASQSLQETGRSQNRQNERGDNTSFPTNDQIHSRDHVDVKATSDDVFV